MNSLYITLVSCLCFSCLFTVFDYNLSRTKGKIKASCWWSHGWTLSLLSRRQNQTFCLLAHRFIRLLLVSVLLLLTVLLFLGSSAKKACAGRSLKNEVRLHVGQTHDYMDVVSVLTLQMCSQCRVHCYVKINMTRLQPYDVLAFVISK